MRRLYLLLISVLFLNGCVFTPFTVNVYPTNVGSVGTNPHQIENVIRHTSLPQEKDTKHCNLSNIEIVMGGKPPSIPTFKPIPPIPTFDKIDLTDRDLIEETLVNYIGDLKEYIVDIQMDLTDYRTKYQRYIDEHIEKSKNLCL